MRNVLVAQPGKPTGRSKPAGSAAAQASPACLRAVDDPLLDVAGTLRYATDSLLLAAQCSWPSKVGPGGLAQLGERLDGIQKVRGSSPLSSTSFFRLLSLAATGARAGLPGRDHRSRLYVQAFSAGSFSPTPRTNSGDVHELGFVPAAECFDGHGVRRVGRLDARAGGPAPWSAEDDGKQTGWIYATLPLACIFAPLASGYLADKWLNAEWILLVSHAVGAVLAGYRGAADEVLGNVLGRCSSTRSAIRPRCRLVNKMLLQQLPSTGHAGSFFGRRWPGP